MKIRIKKQNKYRLPVGACIKVDKNDYPYASRLIRQEIAEQITEKEFTEWVAKTRTKAVKKEDCEGCKKTKKKCKNCN